MAKGTKSTAIMVVLLVIGLLIGSIVGDILGSLGVPYIHESTEVRWNPAGDLGILLWDIDVIASINLASVIGLALVFYFYRRL